MLRNYFKTALRNLWRNKGFSAINIIGLSVGLATCLLIVLYVVDELSYDRWNKKADRIYRLDAEINFGGNHLFSCSALRRGHPALQDYPEVNNTPGTVMPVPADTKRRPEYPGRKRDLC